MIQKRKVITIEGIVDSFKRSGASKVDLSREQIEEIVNALVLDHEVMEVKSTGSGEFDLVPIGKICYKCYAEGGVKGEPRTGALTSIPCGLCPRISHCTPNGIISPRTCVHYTKCALQFMDDTVDTVLDKGGLDALMEPEVGSKLGSQYLSEALI